MKKRILFSFIMLFGIFIGYSNVDAQTWTVYISGHDSIEVEDGTAITLPEDDDGYDDPGGYADTYYWLHQNFDNNLIVRRKIEYTESVFVGWRIAKPYSSNYTEYAPGEQYVVTRNTDISGNYKLLTAPDNVDPNYIFPQIPGYTFIGWFTKPKGGQKVDLQAIGMDDPYKLYNNNFYAHWVKTDPLTDIVIVNWDGEILVYPKGETVDLDREKKKTYDEEYGTIYINRRGNSTYDNSLEMEELKVRKKSTRNKYLINGVEHQATGSYTFNQDTTIESKYTIEYIYPDVPEYDYNGFIGIYDNNTGSGGTKITTFENAIKFKGGSQVYYARYSTVNVYQDGVLRTNTVPRENYSLFSRTPKDTNMWFNLNYDVPGGGSEWATKSKYKFFYREEIDYYMINGEKYLNSDVITITEDTYMTSHYAPLGKVHCLTYDYFSSRDNYDIGKMREDSGHTYYLEGWYTAQNGGGTKIDFEGPYIEPSILDQSASDQNVGQTVYANWVEVPATVNVTIDDGEPYTQAIGANTLIPAEKEINTTKPDDSYNITFDYQDGTTPNLVKTINRSYTLDHYTVDGQGTYQRNDLYTFYKDVSIKSNYSINYTRPEFPTVSDPTFMGWYTKPNGGSSHSNYNNLTEETTLYARYYTGTVNVRYDGVDLKVPVGYSLLLEEKAKESEELTLNLHYGGDYPDKPVHFTKTYTQGYYQIKSGSNTSYIAPGTVIIINRNTDINTQYESEVTNDFVGYDNDDFDQGMIVANYDWQDNRSDDDIVDTRATYLSLEGWYLGFGDVECEGRGCYAEYENESYDWYDYFYPENLTYYFEEQYDGITLYPDYVTVSSFDIELWDPIDDTLYTQDTLYPGDRYCLDEDGYSKQGYIFGGWYTDTNWSRKVEGCFYPYEATARYYARWIEDTRENTDQTLIALPDGTTEIVPKGSTYELPVNNTILADKNISQVTFDYEDGVTSPTSDYVKERYTPNGWMIKKDDDSYWLFAEDGEEITCNADIIIISSNVEVEKISPDFPTPTNGAYTFKGWYNHLEEGGIRYTSYTKELDRTFHAKWELEKPTDLDVDDDELTLFAGDTHQIEVTFTPDGTTDDLVYSDYDNTIISVSDEGLITAIAPGETTIKVALESNSEVYKEISVTILGNELTSEELTIKERTLDGNEYRIIVGEEPNTPLEDFLAKLDNERANLKAFNKDGEEIENITDETYVSTGMVVKLVINDNVVDEAIVIVRGDINEDGLVDAQDKARLKNHLLGKDGFIIDDYRAFACDLVEDEEAVTIETIVDAQDNARLANYLLGKPNSDLNPHE